MSNNFDKDANVIQGGKAIFKKKNGDGKTGYPHTKVDPYTLIFLFWQPKLTNIVE